MVSRIVLSAAMEANHDMNFIGQY